MFSLEQKLIGSIKKRLKIETEITDTEKELSLTTKCFFDGVEVSTFTQDLEPLLEAFEKRLKK